MADDLALIGDLALVLVTAGITAVVFHKLRLPLVLGYLAAGVLVGPHLTPLNLVRDQENIEVLAQLGVLFLLFALGLHFHLGRLRRVGGLSFTAGILEVSTMVGVGYLAGTLFGWRATDALFLGAVLAISSTTMIVKTLSELGRMREPSTQAIFGILLVEDLVAVVLIALLSSLGAVSAASLGLLALEVAVFIMATLVIGLTIVPRLIDYVAKLRVEEVLILLAVGVAFATSLIAMALGLSIALGAFIAGAIIAESKASQTVERRIGPLRDVFGAVFFVSTGILIVPADIGTYWLPILVLAAVTIIGKMSAVTFATFAAGYPAERAVRVGVGMAMIGEFSFVIAGLGRDTGVTADFLFPIAVSVSAITAFVTPLLIRRSDSIIRGLTRIIPADTRSYATMYTTWMSRGARNEPGTETFAGKYDIGAIVRAASYGAVLLALAVGSRVAQQALVEGYGESILFAGDVSVAVYAVALLLAVPIVLGLVRAVRQLVDNLVRVIIPPRVATTPRGAAASAVLRRALYGALAVVFTVVAFAASVAFLPTLPLLAAALGVVLVAAFLLRGALKRLNLQLEGAVNSVLRGDISEGGRDEVLGFIRERYPWDVHVESTLIPGGSSAANRRIRDLQLPQRTGATIITHERNGRTSVNPTPDTLVLPGDTLVLLGEREQVAHGRALLLAEPPEADRPGGGPASAVEIEEIDVHEDSPICGLTLAGSRIRETTGASVVGLRREGVPILNPAPVLRLRPGDSVVVLGSAEQVAAARRLLAAP